MEELTISLLICDRNYRLSVAREHEELFRKAVKMIDHRVHEYSTSYAYKDRQDLLAMVALEFTTRCLQQEHLVSGREEYLDSKLSEIDKTLDTYLSRISGNVL